MFDPVCGMKVEEKKIKSEYANHTYFFCSVKCKEDFQGNPKKFAVEPIIKLEEVWKIYKLGKVDVPVLRGLSLRISHGDFVAIIGPSGSGKTTAMNMVGCLDLPTRGKIFLGGQDISELRESQLAEIRGKKIGFVFQQFNLISSLSALDNVILPLVFQGVSKEKAKQRALSLLELVGLKERVKHRPAELSGGEQQRVAIARALINNPDVILADEPTGNLDSETGKKVMDLLVNLWKKEGKTLIVVTHDPYVASFAQRLLNLRDGRIIPDHGYVEKFLWKNHIGGR